MLNCFTAVNEKTQTAITSNVEVCPLIREPPMRRERHNRKDAAKGKYSKNVMTSDDVPGVALN